MVQVIHAINALSCSTDLTWKCAEFAESHLKRVISRDIDKPKRRYQVILEYSHIKKYLITEIMTAEEYIENIVSAHANMRWMDASELREILNKVTDMTRKEERENAVNQLQIVLTAIVARNDSKINFGDIIDQFTELINQ